MHIHLSREPRCILPNCIINSKNGVLKQSAWVWVWAWVWCCVSVQSKHAWCVCEQEKSRWGSLLLRSMYMCVKGRATCLLTVLSAVETCECDGSRCVCSVHACAWVCVSVLHTCARLLLWQAQKLRGRCCLCENTETDRYQQTSTHAICLNLMHIPHLIELFYRLVWVSGSVLNSVNAPSARNLPFPAKTFFFVVCCWCCCCSNETMRQSSKTPTASLKKLFKIHIQFIYVQ